MVRSVLGKYPRPLNECLTLFQVQSIVRKVTLNYTHDIIQRQI